jgi:hypothetical protein
VSDMLAEVDKFRDWANTVPPYERSHTEWECSYEHWDDLHNAVFDFVARRRFDSWSSDELRALLYAVARDEEILQLAPEIRRRHPEALVALARAATEIGERNAQWQLAVELSQLGQECLEAEPILLIFARGEDEYVRCSALLGLTELNSSRVESLALETWNRPDSDEFSRMQVLKSLRQIKSPHFERLLGEAERDERTCLAECAKQFRQEQVDA